MTPTSSQGIPAYSLGHQIRQTLSLQELKSTWRHRLTWGWSDFLRVSFDWKTPIKENTVLIFLIANGKLKPFGNGLKLSGKICNSQGTWFFCFRDLQDIDLPYVPTRENRWVGCHRDVYVWQGWGASWRRKWQPSSETVRVHRQLTARLEAVEWAKSL